MEDNNKLVSTLPEAGGVAWCDLYTPMGGKISLTSRGNTPIEALDSLVEAIKYAYTIHKLATVPYNNEASGGEGKYRVETVFHDIDMKGTHHIKVRCGKWIKYGLYAYDQVLPESVKDKYEEWTVKKDILPPAEMAYAIVDESGDKPRIRGFSNE